MWYNVNNNNYGTGYEDFCNLNENPILKNMVSELPINENSPCYVDPTNRAGICCNVSSNNNSWAAWIPLFANQGKVFCVDSRGMNREFNINEINTSSTICSKASI